MIFQLATPVKMSMKAPMSIAITEVSPTEPGMLPRNMFRALYPWLLSPSRLADARGVAPEKPSTREPPVVAQASLPLLRPPIHTRSPDILLG